MRAARPIAVRVRAPPRGHRAHRFYSTDATPPPAASPPSASSESSSTESAKPAARKRNTGSRVLYGRVGWATKLTQFNGPWDKPVVALTEAGSDAVLGPLVVAAVMFDPPTLEKLSKVKFPKLLTMNPASQRETWAAFMREHATKIEVQQASVFEINDVVQTHRNMQLFAKCIKAGQDTKITIEDVVYSKMLDTMNALGAPDGSTVVMHVPKRDKRFNGRGDVRYNQMHLLRKEVVASKFPNLNFITTTSHFNPMWMYGAYTLAKTTRDETFNQIAEAHHAEAGTGYLHDHQTRVFLRKWSIKKRSEYPLNLIRHRGWNSEFTKDWQKMEETRYKLQRDAYYKKYPFMVNDPLRKTGVFRKIQDELDAKKAEEEAKRRADRIAGIIID